MFACRGKFRAGFSPGQPSQLDVVHVIQVASAVFCSQRKDVGSPRGQCRVAKWDLSGLFMESLSAKHWRKTPLKCKRWEYKADRRKFGALVSCVQACAGLESVRHFSSPVSSAPEPPFCLRKDHGGNAGCQQARRIWKKTWASPHWMGQYFVISYLSAVLALYCQAIWMPPGLMCLFSCHSKGSWEYLSSFSRCRTEAKWHIQSYPENLRWSKELVSFLLD